MPLRRDSVRSTRRIAVVLMALANLALSHTHVLGDDRTAVATSDPLAGFDSFVNQAIHDWEVPGLAIAVVKNGKVILAQGFGLRDVDKKLPVTPKTLFAIGSCTKAFTTFLMGTLVDEGKLDWDKPVRTYIPEFRLHDRVASELITPAIWSRTARGCPGTTCSGTTPRFQGRRSSKGSPTSNPARRFEANSNIIISCS